MTVHIDYVCSETFLVAFRHFSHQFGLCRHLAIRGAVAHPPCHASEEKVNDSKGIGRLIKSQSPL